MHGLMRKVHKPALSGVNYEEHLMKIHMAELATLLWAASMGDTEARTSARTQVHDLLEQTLPKGPNGPVDIGLWRVDFATSSDRRLVLGVDARHLDAAAYPYRGHYTYEVYPTFGGPQVLPAPGHSNQTVWARAASQHLLNILQGALT